MADIGFKDGHFASAEYAVAHQEQFNVKTKRVIEPFNYYCTILLAPDKRHKYLNDITDQGLVDYFLKEASRMYYVYNNKPGNCIPISTEDRDSRDFWNWLRCISIIAQYSGWKKYENKYVDWIMSQRNEDGLWKFPKRFAYSCSNIWKGNNKVIDSTIYVLRLLMNKRGY